jgi:CysZ protein
MKTVRNYLLALSQLKDPRLWKPILWATLLSLATILILAVIGGAFLFQMSSILSIKLTGWLAWAGGWVEGLAAVLGIFFVFMVGYFFLASVFAAYLGLFIDDALDAVREAHYPDSLWVKPPGIIESSVASLKFILWSLLVYILASPILLIAFFIPPLGLALHILLGGHLLGREYAQLVELRIPREHRHPKAGNLSHGAFASFLWLFPFINLIAPLLLACSLVHARLSKDAGNLSE